LSDGKEGLMNEGDVYN